MYDKDCNKLPYTGTKWTPEQADKIVLEICNTYSDAKGINHIEGMNLPPQAETIKILNLILEILFPGYKGIHRFNHTGLKFIIGDILNEIFLSLKHQIEQALRYACTISKVDTCNCLRKAEEITIILLQKLPDIREQLKSDVAAAMKGDPAAKSIDEVVISYPGIRAIATQRVANVLYSNNVPLLPRVMAEYAHEHTGIDIHPGAKIGKSFFIDHGTGVVIGETAVIGDNVKIYQGVTLGALSFPKQSDGTVIKGLKRHPTLEKNVTIYAGATILGDIIIGEGSVIGGNVWLTESLPENSKVSMASPKLVIKTRQKK